MTNTKAERRLAITPGDWQADNYSVLDAEGHEVVSTDNRELTILIADAGTVYNACHLTPSEMLAELTKLRSERDELVGALRWLYVTAAQSSWAHIENPEVKCDCKRCAVLNADSILATHPHI